MESKNKKLTSKDLNNLGLRSAFLQASFSYERMQAGGWTWAQIPIWEKIYGDDKDSISEAMSENMEFMNTSPPLVSILMGLLASLYEQGVDNKTIQGLKNALFGSMAGIGDSLFWFTALPIVGGVSASIASNGNIFGPILFLAFFVGLFLLKMPMAKMGYRLGVKSIDVIEENSAIVSKASSILGITVIGALISSYVDISLDIQAVGVDLQTDVIDTILPNLLPLGFTFLLYWLLKRDISPTVIIAITFVLAIVFSFIGIM